MLLNDEILQKLETANTWASCANISRGQRSTKVRRIRLGIACVHPDVSTEKIPDATQANLGRLLWNMELESNTLIPVPWGVIAAKCWGNKSGKPFLGLHGWLNNANTFDKLAPLLPEDIYLVAIDLPGHGKSSFKPKGIPWSPVDWVIDVKWVISRLKWKRFSLIGHSMGADAAALYAGTFPDEIVNLILLEYRVTSFHAVPEKDASKLLAACASHLVSSQSENSFKVFPNMKVMVAKLRKVNPDLDEETAIVISERSTYYDGETLALKRDQRMDFQTNPYGCLKGQSMSITEPMVHSFLSNISCCVLVVNGANCFSVFSRDDAVNEKRLNVIEKNAKFFKKFIVPGNHYVHFNNPSIVGERIALFLKEYNLKCKL